MHFCSAALMPFTTSVLSAEKGVEMRQHLTALPLLSIEGLALIEIGESSCVKFKGIVSRGNAHRVDML